MPDLDLLFEVLIDDLTSYYKERNIPVSNERNFPLGSMQGNYTWSELNQRHEELKNMYPEIISEKIILGQSYEGNDIWAFKISDNAGGTGDARHRNTVAMSRGGADFRIALATEWRH